MQAIEYYGRWAALEVICSQASKEIKGVKANVHRFVREHPKDSEATNLVHQLTEMFQEKAVITYLKNDGST